MRDMELFATGHTFFDEPELKRIPPSFDPGLIIERDSLVIDKNGVAWWVRPQAMMITKVRVDV